ncbi:MAG: DUF3592 domain-containing protein [Planctomycetes bacterium]|nr:DUF3592 domain-containing protein [Planctomycetota bacterium]
MEAIFRLAVFIVACLAGGFLLFIGGFLIVAFLLTVWKGVRTRRWPVTFGRVITSGAATERTEDMPEEWSLPDQPGVVYEYEYEVEGKRHTADALQIRGNMQTTLSVRRERELLSRYPPQRAILVYYNPAKPEEAVLQPGVPRGLLPLTAGGAVMFLVGLGLILIFTGAMTFPPGPWVTGLAFLVPGLALILFALWNIWTVVASWHWPTTEAEVTHSEVVQGLERLRFQPSVACQYEVQGLSYTATAIDWGRFDMPRTEAQRVVDKYPVGELVTVHHHPMKPHRAVIEPRGGWIYCLVLLFGVVFAVAGITAIRSSGGV